MRAWNEVVLARAAELSATAAWLVQRQQAAPRPGADELLADVRAHLEIAEESCRGAAGRPWLRFRRRLNGADVDLAAANLAAAEVLTLRLAPPEYTQAVMPSLLEVVRNHLPATDERAVAMERLARRETPFSAADVDVVAAAVRDAREEGQREISRVRSFRNLVYIRTAVIALLVAGACAVGIFAPDAMPPCFEPEGMVVCATAEAAVPGEAANGGADAVASAQLRQAEAERVLHETVGPGDVPLVLLMGLLGAALASAVTLRHMRGTSTPYAVPTALAVLKLPTGALTALLGLLLMRGEFVPGLTALDTSAQILAWAVGLGYAQQLFTQFVDARGKEVLDDVRGGGRAPATVPAAPPPAQPGAVIGVEAR